MTYGELYESVDTWAASHVAKDLVLMMGRDEEASESDIKRVQDAVRFDQLTEMGREARIVWRGRNCR